jgi:hypothetical protein
VPSFAGNQQQDAHELTRFLLERLRLEFVRGIQLVATQAAKENGKLLPRGNEHGIGANVMGDLGIPGAGSSCVGNHGLVVISTILSYLRSIVAATQWELPV